VTVTSSDMQDTPAGRRAARADGPRSSRPRRRTFTAAYKLAMIEKYDASTEPGAKGALLRGEGLYDSHISYWRKARESGALAPSSAAVPADGVPAVAHKGRPGVEAENERLRPTSAAADATSRPGCGVDPPYPGRSCETQRMPRSAAAANRDRPGDLHGGGRSCGWRPGEAGAVQAAAGGGGQRAGQGAGHRTIAPGREARR